MAKKKRLTFEEIKNTTDKEFAQIQNELLNRKNKFSLAKEILHVVTPLASLLGMFLYFPYGVIGAFIGLLGAMLCSGVAQLGLSIAENRTLNQHATNLIVRNSNITLNLETKQSNKLKVNPKVCVEKGKEQAHEKDIQHDLEL